MSREIRPDYQQQFLLPPSLDEWVPWDHPVRFVREVVKALEADLPTLGFRTGLAEDEGGRTPYSSSMLLEVWLFGWMERVRSSRALEKACLRDVAFLWLTGNHHPDHNTLWRFFRNHRSALRKLFKRMVQLSVKAGLVGFVEHALDGTKIGAASSTRSALHRAPLERKLAKLDAIVDEAIAQIEAAQAAGNEPRYPMPEAMLDVQERRRVVLEGLARLEQEEVNHLHPSEPQARVMKAGTHNTLAYNAQVVVDGKSDLIVAQDVVNDPTDYAQLVPMVEQVQDNTGAQVHETLADSGYFSGEPLAQAEVKSLDVLVRPKADRDENSPLHKSRFCYDAERDGYVCPRGEFLPLEVLRRPGKSLRHAQATYRCHNADCPVRSECTDDKKGRTVSRGEYEEAMERARQRFVAPGALQRYQRRAAIVEHLFGIAKGIDGFRRFTVRGLAAARAQWSLLCTAINLRKLYLHWRLAA